MAQEQQQEVPQLRLAEILSDLVSLRVCDPKAALALVSATSSSAPTTNTATNTDAAAAAAATAQQDDPDPDLKRAKDLLKYHVEVKEAQRRGELSRGLEEARAMVERAVGG